MVISLIVLLLISLNSFRFFFTAPNSHFKEPLYKFEYWVNNPLNSWQGFHIFLFFQNILLFFQFQFLFIKLLLYFQLFFFGFCIWLIFINGLIFILKYIFTKLFFMLRIFFTFLS